jgi:ribulose-phosphate 3-epimerase
MKTLREIKEVLKGICVSPSLLSCDFSKWAEEIAAAKAAGANLIHWDIMDAHFVPNLTFGHPVVKKLRPHSDLVFDVHLMIDDPVTYAPKFREAGADIITMHIESPAFDSPEKITTTLKGLKDSGCAVGLVVKPKTPAEAIFPYLDLCDIILVMTVEPGFGGQSFMADMLPKIETLKSEIEKRALDCAIEVDGGVDGETKDLCFKAGATAFVAGSYLFGKPDMAERIKAFYAMEKK